MAAIARSRIGENTFRAAVADGATTPPARLAEETLAWVESLRPNP